MSEYGIREARADMGIEQPEPTPREKYEKRKAELEAIVAAHPKCQWARNELKFLSPDDFDKPCNRRPLTDSMGRRGVCDAAVAAERRYHGGYID